MVKGFKKTLSFILAMIVAFGAMPIAGVLAFAEDEITEPVVYDYESISVSPASVSLYVGEKEQLAVSGAYTKEGTATSEAVSEGIAWSSSNTAILTVSNTGVITAVALPENLPEGQFSATVTVKAHYKNPVSGNTLESSATITVKKAPVYVSSIVWKFTNAAGETINSVIEGKSYSFDKKYQILPSNADNKEVEVTCEPELALEIDNENKTFKVNDKIDDGIVRVTIKTKDGSKLSNTMTLRVYSKKELEVKGVRWTWAGRDSSGITQLSYYEGTSNKVVAKYPYEFTNESGIVERKYKLTPEFAIEANAVSVEFKSSDKRVVYFDEAKKLLVPNGNGYADITIIVTTENGEEYTDTMGVVIKGAPYTPVTGLEMTSKDPDGKYTYVKEYTLYYTETIDFGFNLKSDKRYSTDANPAVYDSKGKLLPGCTVTWSSTDESVIVIDENGKATCKDSGEAEIILTVEDNGETYEARCKINAKIRWWQWLIRVIFGWIASIF